MVSNLPIRRVFLSRRLFALLSLGSRLEACAPLRPLSCSRWFALSSVIAGLAVLTPCALSAGDDVSADSWAQRGLAAEKNRDPLTALGCFQRANELKPGNAFILQRLSRQYSDCTVRESSPEKRRQLSESALLYSRQAYELEPKNPVYVLSMAICYGKLGLYGDARTRVENARLIKQFADEALALDPNYDWAHHVLGRWNREVADLGGAKRFFAGLLYGGLPKASYEEAIRHLEKAVELSPSVAAHHVELGFAYAAAGRQADARREWKAGLALPVREIHDEDAQRRAREALGLPVDSEKK